jgi:conjugative transfer signal peptidase TraF
MIGQPDRRALRVVGAGFGLTTLLLTVSAAAGVHLNTTASVPLGFYIAAAEGDLVELCPPSAAAKLSVERGYRRPGNCPDGAAPLLKPIAARAGDIVAVSASGISVNGKLLPNSTASTRDSRGRPLTPWPVGVYNVQPNTIWLISTYRPGSFDSRYFGPVPTSLVRTRLRPFLIAASGPPPPVR